MKLSVVDAGIYRLTIERGNTIELLKQAIFEMPDTCSLYAIERTEHEVNLTFVGKPFYTPWQKTYSTETDG